MTVENTGSGPATIDNIVVNLQTSVGNKWVTLSSDIADATNGDAATTAKIHAAASSEGLGTFSENSASGTLQFMDATNNTVFSLVPQVLIGPGESRTLLFQAAFDNNVLNLSVGTSIRSEVIVSFGNATQGGNSTVTLSDTLDDIATTGTVTFSNAQFNLGTTSGTVTATVSGGTDGGTITNCAHLTGDSSTVSAGGYSFPMINGVDLEDCSTINVGGTPTCTPGAPGCGWEPGDMTTHNQASWGSATAAGGQLLTSNFVSVLGASVVVGGPATMTFTSASAVHNYLPSTGTPAALTGSLLNPQTSASGELGGEVLALRLNVAFSDDGLLGSASPIGSLSIGNFSAVPQLNGQTINQFLGTANAVLGGGSTVMTPAVVSAVSRLINNAFASGTPSTFAQANLINGSCP